MASDLLTVDVVEAHGPVWSGEAQSVIVRTTEGDIGIRPRHEPFLGLLVPCAAEVLSASNERDVIAVEGGFVSVQDNHVSIISEYATLAGTITLSDAEAELAAAEKRLEAGDNDEQTQRRHRRALAQVKAARLASGRH